MPGFRSADFPDMDNDNDGDVFDALDVDATTNASLDGVMKGGKALPDPDFELIRQAFPNRPRPHEGYANP